MICVCLIYRDKNSHHTLDDGNWSSRWEAWVKLVEPLYATKRVLLDLGAGLERTMLRMVPGLEVEQLDRSDLLISSIMLLEADNLDEAKTLMGFHPDIDHSNAGQSASYLVIQPVHYLEMAQ